MQTLDLRQGRGQRRAQFMGAVGSKAALGFQGLAQALQQMIDRLGQRGDFRRQSRHVDRRQITHAASLHGATIGQYTAQADAHKHPGAKQADGNQRQ